MPRQVIDKGVGSFGAGGDNAPEVADKINAMTAELYAALPGFVAGGAGFVDVSGAVELDLNEGDTFLRRQTGNITGLTTVNIPTGTAQSKEWYLVLLIDATGGYSASGFTGVTWMNGSSAADLNLTADAVNIVYFRRFGEITYTQVVFNTATELPEIAFDFSAGDGTQEMVIRTPCTIDVENATVAGAGTIVYEKDTTTITVATAFTTGDVLKVTAEEGQKITIGVFQ